MQQSLTITIDQNNSVYYGGMSIGTGEHTFNHALDEVPVSMVEKILVRDERQPESAKKWIFYHPHEFTSLREAVQYFPAENYQVSEWEQSELRQEESVYIDPELLAGINFEPTRADYLPKPRPAAPEPEVEEDEEVAEAKPDDEELRRYTLPEDQPEPEPEPEPEIQKPKLVLVRPENSEDIDWQPGTHLERNLSEGEDDEQDLFRPYVDTAAVVTIPKGVRQGQIYLPGERLEVATIAEKKARFKVNKKRSWMPVYLLAAAVVLAGLFAFFQSGGFAPPTEYTAYCIDSRTQLITDAQECKDNQSDRTVVYVLNENTEGLGNLSPIPETALFERPDGNVEISEL